MQIKNKALIIVFGLMLLAQWIVPAQMVYEQESAISQGTIYKFKTTPIDPDDPFRGKYVQLNFDLDSYATPYKDWEYGSTAYAYIKKDAFGYAVLDRLSEIQEQSDLDYIPVTIKRYYKGKIHFDLPFDRFYMDETKAYDAEVAHRNAQRESEHSTYAIVSVKNETSVLLDVIINNESIKDIVEKK